MKWSIFLPALALFPIAAGAQTPQQTDNLYTFARLYGYVRYFHPSDANVVTDWDKFAIYGAREVERAANKKELRLQLEKLFGPVAPSLRIYETGQAAGFDRKAILPPDTAGMKVVTWQHNGYGAGGNNQTYRSVRTNSYVRGVAPWKQYDFSTITGHIDAKPYQGRMIRYSAAMKAEDMENGTGQLWLRVDRKGNKAGFFDNMDSRPVSGKHLQWRRDTIAGRIDADAEGVAFGCLVKRDGRLLLDDVKLEIQTPAGDWETITSVNGDFEKDTAGAKPGYWWFQAGDPVFTVKATGKGAATGKQALLLERTTRAKYMEKSATLFPVQVKPGATITKDIGSGLSIIMPVALWGNGEQTWPLTDTLQAVRRNGEIAGSLPQPLTADDLYVRLADVIITWNVFQHFHPYYKEWITDWDQDLRQALQECYRNRSVADFAITLKTLAAKMRDGHTGVRVPVPGQQGFVPVKWEWVEDQLVVTDVLDTAVPLRRGDVIAAINGQPAKAYISDAAKKISAGSLGALTNQALLQMSVGPKDSAMALTTTSGKPVNLAFSHSAGEYYRSAAPEEPYRMIDSATVYVNMSMLPWAEMKTKLPEMARAKVLIFDMRGYPKDNNGFMLLPHLMKQPENVKWMQQQQLTLPDHERTSWSPIGWNLQPARPQITGKVYFLTNSHAISYAESVMGYVKGQNLGTIIGEPTAGANGDVNTVVLPGGYAFTFTGLKVTNHDGTQHFMKGVVPDVPVYKTIRGIREGRDELLEKAVELGKAAVNVTRPAGGN